VVQSRAAEPARPKTFVPLLEYQREDVESDARFRWNCWSRQTGKSFTKSLRRILRGLTRGRTQIFLSASELQSRELMQKARQHCQTLKIATDYYDSGFFKDLSIKQLEIALPGGGTSPVPFARWMIQPPRFSLSRGKSPRQCHLWPHYRSAGKPPNRAGIHGGCFPR